MNQQEMIQHAWALTEAIEAAADQQDWTRAAELTQARSPLLMALEADQPADSLAIIRRIQTSIEAMMGRAQAAQALLSNAYRKSMDGARAAGQYQKAAYL
jgi:flagellar protein FliT